METEIKEVPSMTEVFSSTDEELEPVVEEEKEADVVDTTVVDETPKGEVEEKVESTESKEEPEAKAVGEPTWTELGLPQYEGLTKSQVAERISFINKEYGRATNTIGELRKQIVSAVDSTVKPSESKETKKSILDAMPSLSEEETIKFNEVYAQSPAKAVMMFGGDTMVKQMVEELLEKKMPKNLDSILAEKTESIKLETFLAKNNLTIDSPEVEWMKKVDTEYLAGQNRPYDELYELCQMWQKKDGDSSKVYELMRKHPTMTLKEAKTLIPKKQAAVVDKTKVVNDINKLKNANHTSRTVKASEDNMQTAESIQEAFEKYNDS